MALSVLSRNKAQPPSSENAEPAHLGFYGFLIQRMAWHGESCLRHASLRRKQARFCAP